MVSSSPSGSSTWQDSWACRVTVAASSTRAYARAYSAGVNGGSSRRTSRVPPAGSASSISPSAKLAAGQGSARQVTSTSPSSAASAGARSSPSRTSRAARLISWVGTSTSPYASAGRTHGSRPRPLTTAARRSASDSASGASTRNSSTAPDSVACTCTDRMLIERRARLAVNTARKPGRSSTVARTRHSAMAAGRSGVQRGREAAAGRVHRPGHRTVRGAGQRLVELVQQGTEDQGAGPYQLGQPVDLGDVEAGYRKRLGRALLAAAGGEQHQAGAAEWRRRIPHPVGPVEGPRSQRRDV